MKKDLLFRKASCCEYFNGELKKFFLFIVSFTSVFFNTLIVPYSGFLLVFCATFKVSVLYFLFLLHLSILVCSVFFSFITFLFYFNFICLFIYLLLCFIMYSSQFNRFTKLRRKRVKYLNNLNFLVKCRKNCIIPKFIQLKCSVPTSGKISKALYRSHFLILRACIQNVRLILSKIEDELYDLHLLLSKNFDNFCELETKNWVSVNAFKSFHQSILDKKFSSLCYNQNQSKFVSKHLSNENCIVNLSSHTLTHDQKSVLEFGLNFSQSSKPNLSKLIAPVEASFKNSKISPSQKDSLRHILANTIASNNLNHKSNLSNSQKFALKELKSNDNLIITKADKGGQIVLMDKNDYLDKVNTLLSDGPYVEVKKDPTNTHFSRVQKVVKSCVVLNEYTKHSVIPSAPNCARFYALPKVHKPNVPLRPIVSNIGTVTYPLSKFLASVFSPLCTANKHTIRNSYDFVNKLNSFNPLGCSMLSLDVKSLFTNVPIEGALNCLESRLREFHFTDIEITEFTKLTRLCISLTTFEFNGKFYNQTDGLSMGNPLSPILCDIYMHYFEEKLLNLLNLKCWLRYVDDTFVLVENPVDTSSILQTANSIDPHIQFTIEVESCNELPFLDVLVTKCDSFFKTCVYRKPFAVSNPPHALSNHPPNQKISAFYTYVYRALKICSDTNSLNQEINYLKSVAIRRGFNPSVIDKILYKFKKPSCKSTLSKSIKNKPDNLIVLPFYPPLCFKLAKNLKRLNYHVIFKPVNKINFPSIKSPVPALRKWGVYNIPCTGCNLSYIGQTKRNLITRVNDHSRYVVNQETYKSSLAKHSWDTGHCFNFKNSTIIFNANCPSELDFLENLAIHLNRDTIVNKKFNSTEFSSAWINLFSSAI